MIEKYQPNDKIYLFGFSRGSFVARILVGMIEKIGLLDNGLESMVKTAWEIYKTWEQIGQPTDLSNPAKCSYSLRLFKQTFCRYDVSIEFMGLFDSINSCGIIFDRLFPFTSNTSNVKHIRHAVSIHERRSKFKQNLFVPHTYLPSFLNSKHSCDSLSSLLSQQSNNDSVPSILSVPNEDSVTTSHQVSARFSKKCSSDLLEVWFPGDHSDVGGNWPYDNNGNRISNLPFRWVLSYAVEFGVLFKTNSLEEFNSKFSPLKSSLSFSHDILSFKKYKYPEYVSPYCLPTDDEEAQLATRDESHVISTHDTNGSHVFSIRSPLFPTFPRYSGIDTGTEGGKLDTFKGRGDESIISTLFWWMCEIIPIGYLVENQQGKWRPLYWPNLGENRNIPFNAKVHWSVLWRMKFVKDRHYANLPTIFKVIEKIIQQEDEAFNTEDNEIITLTLTDFVDLKTGTIRADIEHVIGSALKRNKQISLNIDWKNPPNELSYKTKTRNNGA